MFPKSFLQFRSNLPIISPFFKKKLNLNLKIKKRTTVRFVFRQKFEPAQFEDPMCVILMTQSEMNKVNTTYDHMKHF